MKTSHFFTIVLFVLGIASTQFTTAFAQNKKIDPYTITTDAELYPKRIRIADWIPSTNELAYSLDLRSLQKMSFPSGKTSVVINVDQLNSAFSSFEITLRRLPQLLWKSKNELVFEHGNAYYQYTLDLKKAEQLNSWTAEAESPDFCMKNNIMAYTKGNNLYISVKGKEVEVTSETDPNIRMCNYVHREEFGIKKGTFWSPEGTYLAFYRMDETDVTNYPLVDVTKRIAELKNEKYPMAGMNSHYVTLGVYNIHTGKTTYMKTGEPKEQYLTSVTWSPDEKHIFIGILNRGQNHLKLNMYDAVTGEFVKTLFEETSDKYVEPQHPLYFIPGSNDKFLWMSQRDGFHHLYLYDTTGKLHAQITSGKWLVTDIIGFDSKGSMVFIHATKESPLEQHIYSVNLKNGSMQKISGEEGTYYGSFSHDGKFCYYSYSSLKVASRFGVSDAKGSVKNTLLNNENHMQGYAMPETEVFSIKNDEGTELYCRLIKPLNFDATKKYPVIIYVYGGPHAQLISNSWLAGAGLYLNYLAQEGFLVFTLDNRGSANRGFEFESALHLNMGSVEVEDQMTGVQYLKTLPYVDAERIGVHGWSYGGFLTMSMMLDHPEVFKVGVAGGPVCDWKYYEIMYGERYMGTPENNPKGYENSSLLNKAQNLQGRLLIIHGAVDPVVVWQHSMMYLEKSIEARKNVDYFVYPSEEHNVGWANRGHLHEKIYRYFKDYL
jgi:dipeptidyl-peptidase 4